jgi:hypothetical protein
MINQAANSHRPQILAKQNKFAMRGSFATNGNTVCDDLISKVAVIKASRSKRGCDTGKHNGQAAF